MDPITVTVDDACAALGIKRTKFYEILGQDQSTLRTVKIGKRRLVTTASLREFVAQLEAA
jgi:excisionase family DNA binding protein